MGHAPVRGHLYTMGLFDGDPTCRFCRKETETVQHIICCCEVLARQRYNVLGNLFVEPKEISTASVRGPLPLHKRHRAAESEAEWTLKGCTISPRLRCIWGISWRAQSRNEWTNDVPWLKLQSVMIGPWFQVTSLSSDYNKNQLSSSF
jgi:hypothetical protein